MNSKNMKLYKIALIAILALALSAAIILIFAYREYDETLQHFQKRSALPLVGFIIAALAVVPAISAAIIARLSPDGRLKLHESKKTASDLMLPRFILAAAFFAEFIFNVISTFGSGVTVLSAFATVFAFCSSLSLLARAFAPKNMKVTALLSLFPIGWAVFSVLDVYFCKSLALNSPVKSVLLIAYIYMIVFFISEARFSNRRQVVPFLVFASLASVAALSLVIPVTAVAAAKLFSGAAPIPTMPLTSALLLAIICVFALIRTVDTLKGHLVPHDPVKELENLEKEAALEAEENGKGDGE